MTFSHILSQCPNDGFSKYIRIQTGHVTVCHVRTAVAHCCGMNTLSVFNYQWLLQANEKDLTELFEYLLSLKEKENLSWLTADFLFFLGDDEKPSAQSLINHPYVKEAFTFKSHSTYGQWEHPVQAYLLSIPCDDPNEEEEEEE